MNGFEQREVMRRFSYPKCSMFKKIHKMKAKSQMKVFTFAEKNQPIRVEVVNNETWFVAKDVCRVLEITKHRDAISTLDSDERGSVLVDTLGGCQQMAAVNESGLYHLIFVSRKSEAKKFRRWVTGEVLPSIRKTGSYGINRGGMLGNDLYTGILAELRNWVHREDQELVAMERGCTRDHVREVLGGRKVSMPIVGMLVELGKERKARGERVESSAEITGRQLRLWSDLLCGETTIERQPMPW